MKYEEVTIDGKIYKLATSIDEDIIEVNLDYDNNIEDTVIFDE